MTAPANAPRAGALSNTLGVPALAALNVSKRFATRSEEVWAVRDVSLSLKAGQYVCLMGPSGCGKSTLLALLSGAETATDGDVALYGTMYSTLTHVTRSAILRNDIGVVFQDHQLIPEFTARENVSLPLELQGMSERDARTPALEALDRVGLTELGDRYPDQLSGGQRQRVGIARAIVGRRRVLLADEATGSLDHTNSMGVFRLFRELADSGHLVVSATHDLSAMNSAHSVLHMEDGRVSEQPFRRVEQHFASNS